ncbi:MAG: zinc ribbon domain-containing protein [Myxococcales bacterium]|nr:zinc ribbon domain-containing protein [Myxococcales bacterium]
MPIYAYRCTQCGAEPEYIQKFSDPPMKTCEVCGGELVRQITAAAFHLKGGGWYKDGYASTKPKDGGGEKSTGGSKEGGSSGGSSDASSGGSGGSGGESKASSKKPASTKASTS